MQVVGRQPTAFVAGVGTGGTVMGVARCFKERLAARSAHPLQPANSPTLSTGHKVGRHRIQGISDEFVPSIVNLQELGSIVDIWDGDAIVMAQRLACELGIADDSEEYLSTDLCSAEECKDNYLSRDIELLDYRVLAAAPE